MADRFPEELNIFALSVNSDIASLKEQIKKYHPKIVCVTDQAAFNKFQKSNPDRSVKLLYGQDGLEQLSSHDDVDIILNAVVGFAGLRSTVAAARAGKRIALANKESMVAGGRLVNEIISQSKAEIIPIDSEHSAIFQALHAGSHSEIRKLILTSSGGPFRNTPKEQFRDITPQMALNHPTWNMGDKITVDSATLFNKGLEIIEAAYLFNIPPEKIDVVIHPQSIIHSMVEFIDGSIIAQMSKPDMRLPIQYAMFYPIRMPMEIAQLDFAKPQSLDFIPPDDDKFPSLKLARQTLKMGGTAPAIFNAANEIAVDHFLKGDLRFNQIFELVQDVIQNSEVREDMSIDDIEFSDNNAREKSHVYIQNYC